MNGSIDIAVFENGIDQPPKLVSCDGYVLVAWGDGTPTVENPTGKVTQIHSNDITDINVVDHGIRLLAMVMRDSEVPQAKLVGDIVLKALAGAGALLEEVAGQDPKEIIVPG